MTQQGDFVLDSEQTVWVTYETDYDHFKIIGVYSSKELAEKAEKSSWMSTWVEEFIVNNSIEPHTS